MTVMSIKFSCVWFFFYFHPNCIFFCKLFNSFRYYQYLVRTYGFSYMECISWDMYVRGNNRKYYGELVVLYGLIIVYLWRILAMTIMMQVQFFVRMKMFCFFNLKKIHECLAHFFMCGAFLCACFHFWNFLNLKTYLFYLNQNLNCTKCLKRTILLQSLRKSD